MESRRSKITCMDSWMADVMSFVPSFSAYLLKTPEVLCSVTQNRDVRPNINHHKTQDLAGGTGHNIWNINNNVKQECKTFYSKGHRIKISSLRELAGNAESTGFRGVGSCPNADIKYLGDAQVT